MIAYCLHDYYEFRTTAHVGWWVIGCRRVVKQNHGFPNNCIATTLIVKWRLVV